MKNERLIHNIAEQLRQVRGIDAIVLGGSRAKGTDTPESDIDIGIYYSNSEQLELEVLNNVASKLDDYGRENLVTAIGEWGPWINGGGWLKVEGIPVDLLFRDLKQVEAVMKNCIAGQVTIDYQPGHPHGFLNYIYFGEIAICKSLWDPIQQIQKLKDYTYPFPSLLKKTIVNKFLWEARFSLENAKKGLPIGDKAYMTGSLFRTVSCLLQVLFAINECYFLNEKGAVKRAAGFEETPAKLESRINTGFSNLYDEKSNHHKALEIIEELVLEVENIKW